MRSLGKSRDAMMLLLLLPVYQVIVVVEAAVIVVLAVAERKYVHEPVNMACYTYKLLTCYCQSLVALCHQLSDVVSLFGKRCVTNGRAYLQCTYCPENNIILLYICLLLKLSVCFLHTYANLAST